jgi:hypothetical protein
LTSRRKNYWNNRKEEGGIIYKKCSGCNEWFPETTEYFYMCNKSKPERGLTNKCKKCSIEESKKNYDPIRHTELTNFYYHNDPDYKKRKKSYNYTEKEKDRQKQWRKENVNKINEYSKQRREHKKHNINPLEWQKCKEYFNNQCAYCGMTEQESKNKFNETLHKEHVEHNGLNNLSNCVPACKSCNSFKHTLTLDEFYNSDNPNYTQEKYNKILQWINYDHKLYIMPEKPKRENKKKNINQEQNIS